MANKQRTNLKSGNIGHKSIYFLLVLVIDFNISNLSKKRQTKTNLLFVGLPNSSDKKHSLSALRLE